MDYFAHGFWSYILFHWIRRPIYAVLFGLLPDTVAWVPYIFYRLIIGDTFGAPLVEQIPAWVFFMYGLGHSLIISAAVIIIIAIAVRKIPYTMLAWPIAIIIDLLTHTRDYLPTPFLWPVSDWKFPGISWGNGLFMIINYSLII